MGWRITARRGDVYGIHETNTPRGRQQGIAGDHLARGGQDDAERECEREGVR